MDKAKEISERFWSECANTFKETYGFLRGKQVWIYGSGIYGRFLSKALVDYGCVERTDIKAFINDFESGFEEDGFPVVKLDNCPFLHWDASRYCVVVAIGDNTAVVERLQKNGISCFSIPKKKMLNLIVPLMVHVNYHLSDFWGFMTEERIERFFALKMPEDEMAAFYEDEESLTVLRNRLELYRTGQYNLLDACPVTMPEYFDANLFSLGEDETYIDCGAFTGDSVEDFVAFTGGRYKKIHAFEPDAVSFKELQKNTTRFPNVELHNVATGDQAGSITFAGGYGVSSAVSETGNVHVPVVRLDDYLTDIPTLVKMDIEGAELATLRGMVRILRQNRPKLAISVYHKVEDLYAIPKFIKELVPDYHLKLRQHSPGLFDTVLYAD